MNQEKRHESLSALMDGEASEWELHQVLKQSQENAQLRQTWQRWQIARAALHGEAQYLAPLDLAARVSAALDEVADASRTRSAIRSRLWRGASQCAVAASVTLAVLGGIRFYQSSQLTANPPLQAQISTGLPFTLPLAEAPQLAGFGGSVAPRRSTQSATQWPLERMDWQAERLPAYLHQHYQQGGLYQGLDSVQHARAASLSGQ